MKSKSIVMTVLVLAIIVLSNSISFADSDYTLSDINSQKKNILIVHSYHQEFTWTSELHRGITDHAIDNGWNVYTEYLDIYRKDSTSLELKENQILYHYGSLDVDAIVVTDNNA